MLARRWQTTWSKWLNPESIRESQKRKLSLGDRFFLNGNCGYVWVVDRIFVPPGQGIRHVGMHRLDYLRERRMMSEMVLLDRKQYSRDRRDEQIGDPKSFARRRFDRPGGNVRSTV